MRTRMRVCNDEWTSCFSMCACCRHIVALLSLSLSLLSVDPDALAPSSSSGGTNSAGVPSLLRMCMVTVGKRLKHFFK